jgi:hypothetical protein
MVSSVTRVTENARDELGKSAEADGGSDSVLDLVESKVKVAWLVNDRDCSCDWGDDMMRVSAVGAAGMLIGGVADNASTARTSSKMLNLVKSKLIRTESWKLMKEVSWDEPTRLSAVEPAWEVSTRLGNDDGAEGAAGAILMLAELSLAVVCTGDWYLVKLVCCCETARLWAAGVSWNVIEGLTDDGGADGAVGKMLNSSKSKLRGANGWNLMTIVCDKKVVGLLVVGVLGDAIGVLTDAGGAECAEGVVDDALKLVESKLGEVRSLNDCEWNPVKGGEAAV